MQKIVFSSPQKVIDSLKKGVKIAIFTLNERGEPDFKLSDIKLQSSEVFHSPAGVLDPAVEYVRAHFNKDIKLELLSSLCDLSPAYFSRLFSKTFGLGFSEYLISLRLENAKFLLRNTHRTVVSIACECGYVDCGYFNKLFKKHVGCTPLQYRFLEDKSKA
ncbi:MAG TPA: AraC family transcriptional regulator [Clostridia bacterium]|jgi:AraC-like DNA-binding protein|nr:AraC family transcriptional regulator [Clostridia bacterium]